MLLKPLLSKPYLTEHIVESPRQCPDSLPHEIEDTSLPRYLDVDNVNSAPLFLWRVQTTFSHEE